MFGIEPSGYLHLAGATVLPYLLPHVDSGHAVAAFQFERHERVAFALAQSGGERELAIIRSHGDQALFGRSTQAMKDRLGVPKGRPLADRLHPINVTAKQLATQMTNLNIEQKDLHGTAQIGVEHVGNNRSVRDALVNQGAIPEDLPAQEDIRKVERRVRKDERRVEGTGFKAVESETPDD